MTKSTLSRLLHGGLLLLLALIVIPSQLLAQQDNLLLSIQIRSAKEKRHVLRLAGKVNRLWVDFGDGAGKKQFAVPEEVPTDLNQLKEVPFTVKQEDTTIKIYGEGIRAFGFFRSGSILDLALIQTSDLEVLALDNTHLSKLDLTTCPNLEVLQCFGNLELTSLDLSSCPKLRELQMQYTGIKSIDLTSCKDLETFFAFKSQLEEVKLSTHPKLWYIKTDDAYIHSLDISGCPALQKLHLNTNKLTSLVLQGNKALTDIQLGENEGLQQADWHEAPALKSLYIDHTAISRLDLRQLHQLELLHAQQSRLEMVKVSDRARFRSMMLYGNLLSACALDTLYASLAPLPAGELDTIYLQASAELNNPGIGTSRTAIAQNKGYRLLDALSMELLTGDASGCPGSTVGVEYAPHRGEQCLMAADGYARYRMNPSLALEIVRIYNAQGALIFEQWVTTTELDLSRLAPGHYFVFATSLDRQAYEQTLTL